MAFKIFTKLIFHYMKIVYYFYLLLKVKLRNKKCNLVYIGVFSV